jgi:hypothetical protein
VRGGGDREHRPPPRPDRADERAGGRRAGRRDGGRVGEVPPVHPRGATLFVAEEDPRDSGGLAGQLAAALRRAAPPGLRWHFVTLAERHATVFHPAALQALRTVLAPDAGA